MTLTLLVNAYHSLFGSFNPTGTSFSKLEDPIGCSNPALAALVILAASTSYIKSA